MNDRSILPTTRVAHELEISQAELVDVIRGLAADGFEFHPGIPGHPDTAFVRWNHPNRDSWRMYHNPGQDGRGARVARVPMDGPVHEDNPNDRDGEAPDLAGAPSVGAVADDAGSLQPAGSRTLAGPSTMAGTGSQRGPPATDELRAQVADQLPGMGARSIEDIARELGVDAEQLRGALENDPYFMVFGGLGRWFVRRAPNPLHARIGVLEHPNRAGDAAHRTGMELWATVAALADGGVGRLYRRTMINSPCSWSSTWAPPAGCW